MSIESESNTINLGGGPDIPTTALLVSRDLNARVRVEAAAAGRAEILNRPDLASVPLETTLVFIDLDSADEVLLARAAELIEQAPQRRWIGFFSHIDEDLGRRAEAAGIEAMPRGRFWKALPNLVEGGS